MNLSQKIDSAEMGEYLLKTYGHENPKHNPSDHHSYEEEYYLFLHLGEQKLLVHYKYSHVLDTYYNIVVLLQNDELLISSKNKIARTRKGRKPLPLDKYPHDLLGPDSLAYLEKHAKSPAVYSVHFDLKDKQSFFIYLYKLYMHNKHLFDGAY